MTYSIGNKFAKYCCNILVQVQLIVEDVVTCFLRHSVWCHNPVRSDHCFRFKALFQIVNATIAST